MVRHSLGCTHDRHEESTCKKKNYNQEIKDLITHTFFTPQLQAKMISSLLDIRSLTRSVPLNPLLDIKSLTRSLPLDYKLIWCQDALYKETYSRIKGQLHEDYMLI